MGWKVGKLLYSIEIVVSKKEDALFLLSNEALKFQINGKLGGFCLETYSFYMVDRAKN